MGSQQFCLRWNNHQTNLLGVFDELLQQGSLVDVTLACDGVSMKAHKVVLSACSPFFQSLFTENPCKHPIVFMKDVKPTDLKALIDFMYKGEVHVSQDQLSALLKTAESLKVKGLAEVTGGMNATEPVNDQRPISLSTPEEQPASLIAPPMTSDSTPSTPPKRKRARTRRRSSSGGEFSDNEQLADGQIPLEVVEAKVEVMDEEYEKNEMQNNNLATGDNQTDQTSTTTNDATLPLNSGFGTGNALDTGAGSSSNASLASSTAPTHMSLPPLPPQPTVPTHLPPPSLPSTSGTQSAAQDENIIQYGCHWCDICQKSFANRGNLLRHMDLHRRQYFLPGRAPTNDTMHFCQTCQKKFSNRGNLSRHMMLHCSQSKIQCDECDARFSRMDKLMDHRRNKHGISPPVQQAPKKSKNKFKHVGRPKAERSS